ncbi:MAG: NAD(+)--dinitrogen-reductase ADP-D-ribosyltransferase [Methylovulum sp.]|uniref:NAD(+)--dinitrogen-reductase ADP-D-ribosyltransferase n=1 Tax=Methylovulum sp. TaxID=1916980 RepID=UPI00260D4AFF|nr:NAD(+)--dinitrogen-reductase ADP-D-ribosyltransferase [Methylovulum sp.]MDD2724410.1 NAD(+)--dinitrogen-reductase ADP-D-ribosyltransferase [Methylovulum sp.]MDD5124005.1 NAD(+)--dinitrogen-reductase ADP-D-ribosyltransferase [Methylovulum sp.]
MPHAAYLRHSTNLIGVATTCIANPVFNEHPKPQHIAGTRESASGLFEQLARQSRLADSGRRRAHQRDG